MKVGKRKISLAEEELTLEQRENLSMIVDEGWEAFEHLIQANSGWSSALPRNMLAVVCPSWI